MRSIRKRISKTLCEKSWPRCWQETQAALHFALFIVRMNDVDRFPIVILITFLAVYNLDIPSQTIMKDVRPQSIHLLDQMGIFMGIVLFNYDDHSE